MDDIVKAALAKWPNVPDCYGWLALDARGDWYLRDEPTQAAGAFPQVKGSRIEHPKLLEFIHRNYESDARGCWYFQNGPQRVYVQLEAAPWIWRLDPGGDATQLRSHSGMTGTVVDTWLDEHGRLFAACDIGLGLVHTQDMHLAVLAVEAGAWSPHETTFAELVEHSAVELDPRPMKKAGTRPASG